MIIFLLINVNFHKSWNSLYHLDQPIRHKIFRRNLLFSLLTCVSGYSSLSDFVQTSFFSASFRYGLYNYLKGRPSWKHTVNVTKTIVNICESIENVILSLSQVCKLFSGCGVLWSHFFPLSLQKHFSFLVRLRFRVETPNWIVSYGIFAILNIMIIVIKVENISKFAWKWIVWAWSKSALVLSILLYSLLTAVACLESAMT